MTTYQPKNYTSKLVHGFAQILDRNGFGVYRDAVDYTDDERGIYVDFMAAAPTTSLRESIIVTPYLPQPGLLTLEHTSVQLRYRFANRHPFYIRDLLDDVRALFPDRALDGYEVGGLKFDRIVQTSATTWGEDDRIGIINATQNFRFRGNRDEQKLAP